jgi:hypothetical protein
VSGENAYEYIYISDHEEEGFIKSEQFSVGRYTMSGSSSRVSSKSGVIPLTNTTITNFRNYARNLGIEFGQMDLHIVLIQLLYLIEYADYNSQSKLGQGYTLNTNTAPIASGGCDSLGMKSGCLANDAVHSMIYRGIEDILGNIWCFIDGININNNQPYICHDSTKYAVDKYDDGYEELQYSCPSANGYVKHLGFAGSNPLALLPTEVGGSSGTYVTDNYYQATGQRIVLIGGGWYFGLGAGLFCWAFGSASSDSHATFRCSPS